MESFPQHQAGTVKSCFKLCPYAERCITDLSKKSIISAVSDKTAEFEALFDSFEKQLDVPTATIPVAHSLLAA